MPDRDAEGQRLPRFHADHEAGPLIALIHEVARLSSLQVDAALRPHNLTRAQFLTLITLARQNGMHQTDIAHSLRMGRSAVGKLLDRLEAAGYIRREHDPHDARAVRVYLAGDTLARLDELSDIANARCEEILAPLTPEMRRSFTKVMLALRDHATADPALVAAVNTAG